MAGCADAIAGEQPLPIQRLGWLVGNWETRDENIGGDCVETGPETGEPTVGFADTATRMLE